MKIKEVIRTLEVIAPLNYQESYDNSGLMVGDRNTEVTGVLTSLDCIESIVDEAIEKGCNLIVAHHPIVFKGLKKFTGSNYVERVIIKAIKNDIAIYAIHTNLDNVEVGVNRKIAEKLQLENLRILAPKEGLLSKIVTFVPPAHHEKVCNAMSAAGAGNIGNYQNCSFQTTGTGAFQPNEKAVPFIGKANQPEKVEEVRIEMILPSPAKGAVLSALKQAHPYEEVAYYLQPLSNKFQEVGSGMIGTLPSPLEGTAFLSYLKEKMELSVIRHTALPTTPIKKVAVCGGAGGFLLRTAAAAGAAVLVTADYKYHEFFDAIDHAPIADIGHFESEQFTKELLAELLNAHLKGLKVLVSSENTNPISYFTGTGK